MSLLEHAAEISFYTNPVFWTGRPMLELCIPSSMDPTLAPPGCHVLSIFSQYTPFTLQTGSWTDRDKEDYANCGKSTVLIMYAYSRNFIFWGKLICNYWGNKYVMKLGEREIDFSPPEGPNIDIHTFLNYSDLCLVHSV